MWIKCSHFFLELRYHRHNFLREHTGMTEKQVNNNKFIVSHRTKTGSGNKYKTHSGW